MEKLRKEQAINSAALFTCCFFSIEPFDFIGRSFNMYENKDADQLRSKRATDPCLCFRFLNLDLQDPIKHST